MSIRWCLSITLFITVSHHLETPLWSSKMSRRWTMWKLTQEDLRAECDTLQERWKKDSSNKKLVCFSENNRLSSAGIHQSVRSGRGLGLRRHEKAERTVSAASAVVWSFGSAQRKLSHVFHFEHRCVLCACSFPPLDQWCVQLLVCGFFFFFWYLQYLGCGDMWGSPWW